MPQSGPNESSGDMSRNQRGSDASRPAAHDEVPLGQARSADSLRALCVGLDCAQDARLGTLLDEAGLRHESVGHAAEALASLVTNATDLVFVSSTFRDGDITPLATHARRISANTKVIVAGTNPSAESLLGAMRAGAVDWIDPCDDPESVLARIRAIIDAIFDERRRDERAARLKGISQRVSLQGQGDVRPPQEEPARESFESLSEMVGGRVEEAEVTGEFRGLLSQELDVEDLLRTALQYLLTKTGATNAAVYLPGSRSDQFGLGAYVHYDCPRTMAQPLLDRLGDEICERLAFRDDIIRFTDTREFVHAIGMAGAVLEDAELVAWSSFHEGECMAVFFLFRNRAEPFKDELAALIDLLRPVFGAQMAKLIRIHHRSSFRFPKVQDDGDADGDHDADDEDWRRAA